MATVAVAVGIDTNGREDWDTARSTRLLAALGRSMGSGGAMSSALRRPSLKAAVGLAPFSPSQTLTNMRVPTMLLSGQNDGTTTPAGILNHYNAIPSGTEKGSLAAAGSATFGFIGGGAPGIPTLTCASP